MAADRPIAPGASSRDGEMETGTDVSAVSTAYVSPIVDFAALVLVALTVAIATGTIIVP